MLLRDIESRTSELRSPAADKLAAPGCARPRAQQRANWKRSELVPARRKLQTSLRPGTGAPRLGCGSAALCDIESHTSEARSPAADRRRFLAAGFTLIEVVLAISIAAGILVVVLLFYHQTESLRSRLLEETSRLATMRLVMERLTAELATARLSKPHGKGLSGGAENIQFVRLSFPAPWDRTNALGTVSTVAPLRLVSYSLLQDTNTATESGLLRSEELLAKGSNASTNVPAANDQRSTSLIGTAVPRNGSVASQIQFLRFRYWDGSTWSETWSASDLPMGVEVSLGREPLPLESTADEYPFELYRRVIYLPNHAAARPPSLAGPARRSPAITQVTR